MIMKNVLCYNIAGKMYCGTMLRFFATLQVLIATDNDLQVKTQNIKTQIINMNVIYFKATIKLCSLLVKVIQAAYKGICTAG